jgi:hypothetical protein
MLSLILILFYFCEEGTDTVTAGFLQKDPETKQSYNKVLLDPVVDEDEQAALTARRHHFSSHALDSEKPLHGREVLFLFV